MRRKDVAGLAAVVLATALLIAYRQVYLEPRAWGAACAARGALIWLQGQYLLGAAALGLGLAGFAWGGAFTAQLGAVLAGVAAIENYNATWGAIGLALGAWGWLRRTG